MGNPVRHRILYERQQQKRRHEARSASSETTISSRNRSPHWNTPTARKRATSLSRARA
jgi:hypothetical protein